MTASKRMSKIAPTNLFSVSKIFSGSVVETLKSLPRYWNHFWFEPQSVLPICIFRIIFGAIMIVSFLVQFRRDFLLFYGVNSIIPASSVDVYQWLRLPVFDLFLVLPADDNVRFGFLYFSAFIAFLVMIGFATRITTIILFLCYLSICNHADIILMAGDNFARLIALFLCFSPCGERVSVDTLMKRKSSVVLFPPYAQRMIQVQLCLIYLVNVSWKVAGPQWRDGSAVYHATRLLDYTRLAIPAFLDVPIVSIMCTYSTLILEFAFVFLLWSSNKKLRYIMIALAMCFHLGLDYSFSLGVFEWYFIASLLLFIDPNDVETIFQKVIGKTRKRLVGPFGNDALSSRIPTSERS
ncbi:MAG: HTTM domain-containing protein [Candidatus Melainabacteria bacterium]|nr:HTTM domain-containing protein [Candidatus Melainabacteria bacterium]